MSPLVKHGLLPLVQSDRPAGASLEPRRRFRYQRMTSTAPATAKAIASASRRPFQGAASNADLLVSPLDALSSFLAAEEAVVDPGSKAVSNVIGGVVAEEGSGGGPGNHDRQAQVTRRRDDARGDHRGLAWHDGHEGIEVRQQRDDQVRPTGGVRDEVGELAKNRRLP